MSKPVQEKPLHVMDGEDLIEVYCDECISNSFDNDSVVDCDTCFFGKLRGNVVVSREWLEEDNKLAGEKEKMRFDAHSFAQMYWWRGFQARGRIILGEITLDEINIP